MRASPQAALPPTRTLGAMLLISEAHWQYCTLGKLTQQSQQARSIELMRHPDEDTEHEQRVHRRRYPIAVATGFSLVRFPFMPRFQRAPVANMMAFQPSVSTAGPRGVTTTRPWESGRILCQAAVAELACAACGSGTVPVPKQGGTIDVPFSDGKRIEPGHCAPARDVLRQVAKKFCVTSDPRRL